MGAWLVERPRRRYSDFGLGSEPDPSCRLSSTWSPVMRLAACFLALFSALVPATAAAQESLDPERDEMYARYMAIPSLIKGGVICPDAGPLGAAACAVNWMADGQSFWFAEGQPDQTVIQRTDPAAGVTEPLFDTERLREALTPALGHEPPYAGLPFDSFTFAGGGEGEGGARAGMRARASASCGSRWRTAASNSISTATRSPPGRLRKPRPRRARLPGSCARASPAGRPRSWRCPRRTAAGCSPRRTTASGRARPSTAVSIRSWRTARRTTRGASRARCGLRTGRGSPP